MNTYTVSKDNSVSKIKADVKADITAALIDFLKERYGEDGVGMVRTGSTSKTNEIAVIVGEAENEGETNAVVVTINPTVKEFANRKTDKRTYTAFDFVAARDAYDTYVDEKEAKAAEAAESKAKKIARDKAAREKKAAQTED